MAGQSYNLTCNVSGLANFEGYQWKKDGEPLTNKTNKILLFPSLRLSDTGNYTCVVIMEEMLNKTSNTLTIIPQSEFLYSC